MSSPTSSPMSTSKKRKFDERLAESSTANANAQASSVVATDPTTITESESKSKSGSESESESESEYEYEPEPDEGQSPRNYLPITQGVRSPTRTVPATRARPVNRASYFAVPASLRPANVLGRVRGLLPPWFRRQRPVQRPRPQTQVILVGSLIKSTKRVALDVSRPSAHPFVPNSLPERPRQSIQAGPSNAQLQHDVVMNEAGPSNAQLQHDVDMNEAGPSNAQLQNDVDMNEVALSNAQLQHEFDIAQARPSNAQLQHDVDSTQAGSPNAQLQHVNDSTQAGSPNAQLQHDVDNTQAASSNGQLQHDADSAQAASSNGQLQHDADSAQAASSNGQLQHDADNTQPGPSNGQLQHDIDSAQPGPSNGQLQHDIDSSQAAPSNDQLQHDIELDDRNDYLDDTAGTQTWWRAAVNEETSDDEASIRPSFGRQGQVIPHVLPVAAIYKAARRDVVKSLQSRRWPMGRPTEHAIESRLKDRIFQLITRRRLLLPDEDNPAKLRHIEQKRLERNARIIASFGNATEMRIKHSVAHRREFVDKLIANEKIRSDELLAEEKKVLGYHCYEHFKEFIESCDDQKIAWKPKNTTTAPITPDVSAISQIPKNTVIVESQSQDLSTLDDAPEVTPVQVRRTSASSRPRGILKKQTPLVKKSLVWKQSALHGGVQAQPKHFYKDFAINRDPRKGKKADGMHLPPHLRHPREPKPVDTSLLSMLGSDLQSSPYQASILRDRSPRTAAQDDSVVEVARASLGGWGLGTSTTTTNRPSRPSDLDLSGFISNPADPPSKEDIDALEPSESFCRSVIDARAAKASDEAVREIIEDLCLEYACNDIKRHVKDSQFLTTPAQESRMIKERQAELIRYAVEKLPLARQRAQKAMEPERSSLTATEAADQMHHRIAMEAITMAMHKYAAINDEDIHFQESTMLQDSRLFNDSTMFEGNESTAFGNSTIIEGSSMMPASFLEDTVDGPSAFDQATTHEESTIIGGVSKLSAPAVEEHSDHLSELIEEATARDTSTFVNESSMMPASDFDAYEHDSTAEDSTFGPSDDFLANESSFVHGPEPENVNSDDIDQTNVSSFEHLPRTFRHTLPQISDDPDSNDDSDENDDDHHHDEKNQVTIISDSDDSSSVNGAGSEAESQSEGESEEGSEESAQYSDQESDTASDGLEPPSDQVIIDIPPSLTAVIDAAVSNGVSSVTTRTANFTDAALARIVPNLFPARGAAGGSSAWLNDDSIDDFLALLVKHSNEKQGFNPDDRAATSVPPLVAFSSKWHEVIKAKGYTGVQRWSRRAKVSEKRLLKAKMVFFPINQGGSHWTLLVINVSERTIEFLDSLGGTGGAVLGMARKWLEGELGEEYAAADWADVTLRSGQQHNSSDCGVFTCMNALAIARGDVPREVVVGSRMGAARQQLAATLLVGSFSGVLAW